MLGTRATALQPTLLGGAAGTMAVASVAGLLLPGISEGSPVAVCGGFVVGVLFLLVARLALEERERHLRRALSGGRRTSILMFAVLLVHSLPEGFAIGTAYSSETEGLSLFVIIAIAIQNIPEGTSIAIPMSAAGYSGRAQFWAGVATSAPQPVGALIAFILVDEVNALLPFSFGFAAGAMLALVIAEMLPAALRGNPAGALLGAGVGAVAMVGLSVALGV